MLMVDDHCGTGEAVEEEEGGGHVLSSFILSFTQIHDLNDTKAPFVLVHIHINIIYI
jgi:hypothetical protein